MLYHKKLYLYEGLQTRPWEQARGVRAVWAEEDPPRCVQRAGSTSWTPAPQAGWVQHPNTAQGHQGGHQLKPASGFTQETTTTNTGTWDLEHRPVSSHRGCPHHQLLHLQGPTGAGQAPAAPEEAEVGERLPRVQYPAARLARNTGGLPQRLPPRTRQPSERLQRGFLRQEARTDTAQQGDWRQATSRLWR